MSGRREGFTPQVGRKVAASAAPAVPQPQHVLLLRFNSVAGVVAAVGGAQRRPGDGAPLQPSGAKPLGARSHL